MRKWGYKISDKVIKNNEKNLLKRSLINNLRYDKRA